MARPFLSQALKARATAAGYSAELVTYRRGRGGWPEQSTRPFRLWGAGRLLGAYATAEALGAKLGKLEAIKGERV